MHTILQLIALAFVVCSMFVLTACNNIPATCDLANIAATIAAQNSKAAGVQTAANYAQLCPAIATDINAIVTSAK